MNAPIQGTAADMLKLAMIGAKDALRGSHSRMLLNVHDELVFEVREGVVPKLREAVECALSFTVPVDAKLGRIGMR